VKCGHPFTNQSTQSTSPLLHQTGVGVRSWPSKDACCAASSSGAFGEQGCSAGPPPTPCWLVDTYWPQRTCRRDDDVAVCNRGAANGRAPQNESTALRFGLGDGICGMPDYSLTQHTTCKTCSPGWGVFSDQRACCAPNAAFPEGCGAASESGGSGRAGSAISSSEPGAKQTLPPAPSKVLVEDNVAAGLDGIASPGSTREPVGVNLNPPSIPWRTGAGSAQSRLSLTG
jgi:hypothetical protein